MPIFDSLNLVSVLLPHSSANGFELIGIRLLDALSQFQAREICPYEIGDENYKSKTLSLYGEPACCLVLRRLAAVSILTEYAMKLRRDREFEVIVTQSAPWTHRVIQARVFRVDTFLKRVVRMPFQQDLVRLR